MLQGACRSPAPAALRDLMKASEVIPSAPRAPAYRHRVPPWVRFHWIYSHWHILSETGDPHRTMEGAEEQGWWVLLGTGEAHGRLFLPNFDPPPHQHPSFTLWSGQDGLLMWEQTYLSLIKFNFLLMEIHYGPSAGAFWYRQVWSWASLSLSPPVTTAKGR